MIQVKVLKEFSEDMFPERGSSGAGGLDIKSAENTKIWPGERELISTGLSWKIPGDCVGVIKPRSGLALKHGIDVLAGVIDSDYRGEVKILLINHGKKVFEINKGDRIAQMVIVKQPDFSYIGFSKDLSDDTERGEKGFGSTGV